MKIYYIFFLLLAGGLIFITVKNNPEQRMSASQIQREEAPMTEQLTKNTFRIVLEIESPNDEPVADILWFQQAAELALDKNIPWFNVLEQKLSPGSAEGVIELVKDPMKAEYDANEILSLHLDDIEE
jgi:hypothetical protein